MLMPIALALSGCQSSDQGSGSPWTEAYTSTFDGQPIGTGPPPDMLLLDGAFTAQADRSPFNGYGKTTPRATEQVQDRVLTLPGEPILEAGFMFGPALSLRASDEHAVHAVRVHGLFRGAHRGRLAPRFTLGVAGLNGVAARWDPGARQFQVVHNGKVANAVPVPRHTGKLESDWLDISLTVVSRDSASGLRYRIDAVARWVRMGAPMFGSTEMAHESLRCDAQVDRLPVGRPWLIVEPLAGKPIEIDELRVEVLRHKAE